VYYRGPISRAKRVPLALTLQWSWRVQLAQVGRSFWANRKRPFCQRNCPQIPYWSASQFRWISDGDTSLVSGVGTSIGCLPIRAYEAVATSTHALSEKRLPEGRKGRPEEQPSVTLNAEESQGESCFFLRRMSAGIGTRFGQGFVGFQVLDRPCRSRDFAESICITSSCARLGQRETFRT